MPISSIKRSFYIFNYHILPVLIIFGFGVLTGIALIIKLVKKKH